MEIHKSAQLQEQSFYIFVDEQSQYLLTWGNLQRSGEPALWPGSACQAYGEEEKKPDGHPNNIHIHLLINHLLIKPYLG